MCWFPATTHPALSRICGFDALPRRLVRLGDIRPVRFRLCFLPTPCPLRGSSPNRGGFRSSYFSTGNRFKCMRVTGFSGRVCENIPFAHNPNWRRAIVPYQSCRRESVPLNALGAVLSCPRRYGHENAFNWIIGTPPSEAAHTSQTKGSPLVVGGVLRGRGQ